MKVKVDELSGRGLNYAIAKTQYKLVEEFHGWYAFGNKERDLSFAAGILQYSVRPSARMDFGDSSDDFIIAMPAVSEQDTPIRKDEYNPQVQWAKAGPLIEKYRLSLYQSEDGPSAVFNDDFGDPDYDGKMVTCDGDTVLIAAMRCILKSIVGDEVEIPDELG